MAKAKIDTQDRWRAVTRRDHDGSWIDNHWRRLNINLGRRHHGRNGNRRSRSDGVNWRRSINDFTGVDRARIKGVRKDVDGGNTGENLANRGPFLITGGCGLHAGGGHREETQNCDSFFHAFVFH